MKNEDKKYDALDRLIDETLSAAPDVMIPVDFTERVMHKIEKPSVIRELVVETSMKIGIVAGTLLVLFVSFLVAGMTNLYTIEYFLYSYSPYLIPVALIILFTWIFNDVLLPYLFSKSDKIMQKETGSGSNYS